MDRPENMCKPPEYPPEMFAEYFESAKKRALRASQIESILGDDYDLERLCELAEADRDGRCVMLPCKTGDPVWFKIEDTDGEYISEDRVTESGTRGFWTSGILDDPDGMHLFTEWNEIGKTAFLTRESAEAALKGDHHGEQ